jgi:uncharacterized protein
MGIDFMNAFINCILYFSAYSFLGWILETLFACASKRRFVNRGFLKGCLCPIYGFGALIAIFSFSVAKMATAREIDYILYGIFLSIILATLFEYVSGVLLVKIFSRRYWDYSNNILNIHGHVCLKYSLLWGILSLFNIKIIYPQIAHTLLYLPVRTKVIFALTIALYCLFDFVLTSFSILKKKREHEMEYIKNDYGNLVSDLTLSQNVVSMSGFVQHGNVSCLEHCSHVSYKSYVICRMLKLDYRSAARGGLLHDYFLYDWHNNSPYRLHGFRHPHRALLNAKRDFELNEIECDIIEKHMWPLTLIPPKYKESLIVSMVDKYYTIIEVLRSKSEKSNQHPSIKKYIKVILERYP